MTGKLQAIQYVFGSLNYILTSRQKQLGFATFVMSFVCASLSMLGISVIVPLVTLMMDPESMMENQYVSLICSFFGIQEWASFFVLLCIGVIVLYVVKNLFCLVYTWVSAKYTCLIERELSARIMDSYMHRSYVFFLTYDTARILRDTETDPYNVNCLLRAGFAIISELLTVLMIVIYIIMTDWKMAVCIMLIAFFCLLVIYMFFKKQMKEQGILARETQAAHQRVALEAIEGIKEIQVMRKQQHFLDAYRRTFVKMQLPKIKNTIANTSPTYVIEGMFVSGLMLYICIRNAVDPHFVEMLPLLASFAVGAIRMLPSMGRISSNLNTITFSVPTLQSVTENLKEIEREKERQNMLHVGGSNQEKVSGQKDSFTESLDIRDLVWIYAGTEKRVLNGLALSVKKGQSVGIIGASGAGKSTLADIILGLHIPQSGSVTIDGVDIFSIPDDYARIIGYVPQSIYLVDGSIRENVAFGEDPADVRDEEIWAALEQAQLAEFTRGLEDGLDTVIGERGIRFSGGQRQRLAIARALYRKPQILILDEATSALDNETEAAVMDAIEHLYGTITMIIIAHRLTTVAKCDVVYEIRDGKALETRVPDKYT